MNKITDKATYHILELKKIISSIKPLSEPGKKLKAGLTPFKQSDIEIAKAEYIEIGKIVEYCQNSKSDIEGLKLWLSHIKDLSGSVEVCRDNTLELHEMQELKTLALAVSKISEILAGTDIELSTLNTMKDFYTYLDPQNTETSSFQIYDEFSPELEELRLKLADLSRKKKLAQNAKLNLAKQSLNLTKCEPEIIISRSNKALIGQVNESGIFYLSNENFANLFYSLKEDDKDRQIAEEIANTLTEMKVIEKAVRCQISEHIRSNYLTDIDNSTRAIAQFDLRLSKALFAIKNECVIPHLTTTNRIVISQAVNLPMQKDFAGIEMVYQAVDIDLDNPLSILIGANMAGKTSVLKTVGQLAYLTAYAIPLPCGYAEIPLFDFVYFSGYDPLLQSDNLSSFAYNIVELQRFKCEIGNGLFLIDEFARGTNPQEGEALCRAVLESFLKTPHFVFASTHFKAPAMIPEAAHFAIPGLTEELYQTIKEEQLLDIDKRIAKLNSVQKYNLVRVNTDKTPPRTALMIAELLGVESDVIESAKKYLN